LIADNVSIALFEKPVSIWFNVVTWFATSVSLF